MNLRRPKAKALARLYFTNAVREARQYLGLFEWNIHIRFWEKPTDEDEVGARVRSEIKYLRSTVFYFPADDLETDDDLFHTAVHEMLHVMLYPIIHLATDDDGELTHEQDIAEEQTVTRLARVLTPLIFPGLASENVIGQPSSQVPTESGPEADPQLNTEVL
jgi:hypothetical protein